MSQPFPPEINRIIIDTDVELRAILSQISSRNCFLFFENKKKQLRSEMSACDMEPSERYRAVGVFHSLFDNIIPVRKRYVVPPKI
jgi:hypothetical protein